MIGDDQKIGRETSGISDERNPREKRTSSSPAAFPIVPTDREPGKRLVFTRAFFRTKMNEEIDL